MSNHGHLKIISGWPILGIKNANIEVIIRFQQLYNALVIYKPLSFDEKEPHHCTFTEWIGLWATPVALDPNDF